MHGMFRGNGGCGYLKKPDFLMWRGPNDKIFDPGAPSEVKKNLKVSSTLQFGNKLMSFPVELAMRLAVLAGQGIHGGWMAYGF